MSTDIGDFWSSSDMWYIVTAVLIVDVIGIFLFRLYPKFFGSALNKWYTDFGLVASLCDITIILISFLITRLLYTKFLRASYGWSGALFTGLLFLVQLVHDVFFYLFVILPIPQGTNAIIDLFKTYAKDINKYIYVGDSIMVVSCAVIAMALKNYGDSITAASAITALYSLSYILFTRT